MCFSYDYVCASIEQSKDFGRYVCHASRMNMDLMYGPDGVNDAPSAQGSFIGKHKGLHFNSGRPSTKECMTTLSQYMQEYHRLKMLGNAVIPLQVNTAARILSSLA